MNETKSLKVDAVFSTFAPHCEFCKGELGEFGLRLDLKDGNELYVCHDCLYEVIKNVLTYEQ